MYDLLEVTQTIAGAEFIREQEVDPVKSYTYQDYVRIPWEAGFRLEVLDGALIKELSPAVIHQWIVGMLYSALKEYCLKSDPEGTVYLAPLDVTLGEKIVVQPDLVYIRNPASILPDRINGPPYLVVEVISPSSRQRDRLHKFRIYQREGISHYWLVSPEEKTLECFALKSGRYSLAAEGQGKDVFSHPDFPGISLPLVTLWQGRSLK